MNDGGTSMVSQEFKQWVSPDGAVLEYDIVGTADPVVLIHGAFLTEAYAPLCGEAAVTAACRLVRYHRRGYAGSSRVSAPFSTEQQAADCRALLMGLDIERAHVVGHSSGGAIALQLALDAPELVHSLILLEPAFLDVRAGRYSWRHWHHRFSCSPRARRRRRMHSRSPMSTQSSAWSCPRSASGGSRAKMGNELRSR